jgi:hypothetical protein
VRTDVGGSTLPCRGQVAPQCALRQSLAQAAGECQPECHQRTAAAGSHTRPLRVEAADHPVTAGLPPTIVSAPNEWYRWQNDLRANPDIRILLSIDASSFPLGTAPPPIGPAAGPFFDCAVTALTRRPDPTSSRPRVIAIDTDQLGSREPRRGWLARPVERADASRSWNGGVAIPRVVFRPCDPCRR